MEQRRVGGSGLLVSRLGLGTLTWGRDTDEHEAADQLKEFVEAGGTLVDVGTGHGTGHGTGQGGGAALDVLGGLIGPAGGVPRGEVVLCVRAGGEPSRGELLDDLDDALSRLGTDHVDLWLPSGWDDAIPVEETLGALELAASSGRARYVGLTNLAGWQLAAAVTLARAAAGPLGAGAPGVPVAAQVEYSLVQRRADAELLPAARALGAGLIAWSPLGRGVLTGKYRTGTPADSRAATPHLADFVGEHLTQRARRVVDAVVTAADGLGCSPVEVALAWVREREPVACAVLGARTTAQLRSALTSEDVVLPAQIRAVLDEVSSPEGWRQDS